MKVIFLNGPPGSGKDTAARLLSRHPATSIYKLIWPAEVFFKQAWVIPAGVWVRWREEEKNTPQELFSHRSLREAFIEFSEDYMKPKFGQDIFGRLLVRRLEQDASFVKAAIISDSGFAEEAKPIMAWVGKQNCCLARLARRGCSFAGDSRGYWELDGLQKIIVSNNGTIEDLRQDLDYIFGDFISPNQVA